MTTAVLVATTLLVGVACQPARLGARCATTSLGDDGAHWILQCRKGRWQRALTKQQALQFYVAVQAQQSASAGGASAVVSDVAPPPNDDYPAQHRDAPMNTLFDRYGFPNRQCTAFVAWRLSNTNRVDLPVPPGDATTWDDRLAPYAAVDARPAVGAIAHWNANESFGGLGAGPLGHVAWVQAVHPDGSVTIEQYNLGDEGRYLQMRTRAPRYIHLRDL